MGFRKDVGFLGKDVKDEDRFGKRAFVPEVDAGRDPLLNELRNNEFSAASSPRIDAAVMASSHPRRRARRSLVFVNIT